MFCETMKKHLSSVLHNNEIRLHELKLSFMNGSTTLTALYHARESQMFTTKVYFCISKPS